MSHAPAFAKAPARPPYPQPPGVRAAEAARSADPPTVAAYLQKRSLRKAAAQLYVCIHTSAMVTTVVCPRCDQHTPRLIESPSAISAVTYYRCRECSHVWAVDKNDPSSIQNVTPLDRRTTEKS